MAFLKMPPRASKPKWRSSPASYNKKVDALIEAKEKDIMKV